MAENESKKKAKNLAYIAGTNPYADRGNDGFLTTNIDLGYADEAMVGADGEKFDGQKFEIYWPRPRVKNHETIESLSAKCQEFWGDEADLQTLIDAGITQLMTRPNYKAAAKDKTSKEAKHTAAQEYASGYEVGRKAATGPTVKKKASAYDAFESQAQELGLTMDQVLEIARKQKEAAGE